MHTPTKPLPAEHFEKLQCAPKSSRMRPRTLFKSDAEKEAPKTSIIPMEIDSSPPMAKAQVPEEDRSETPKFAKKSPRSRPYLMAPKKSRYSLPLMAAKV